MAIVNKITGKKEYENKVVNVFKTSCPIIPTNNLYFAQVIDVYNDAPYIKTVMFATDHDRENDFLPGQLLKEATVDADLLSRNVFKQKVKDSAEKEIKKAKYINEGDYVEIIRGKHKGKIGKVESKYRDRYCWYLYIKTLTETCKVTFKVVKKDLNKQEKFRALYD